MFRQFEMGIIIGNNNNSKNILDCGDSNNQNKCVWHKVDIQTGNHF